MLRDVTGVGGVLGPALTTGTPSVTFGAARPFFGISLMLAAFAALVGFGAKLLHPRMLMRRGTRLDTGTKEVANPV